MLEPVRRSNVFGLTPPPSLGILTVTVFPSSSVCGAFWLAGQGPNFVRVMYAGQRNRTNTVVSSSPPHAGHLALSPHALRLRYVLGPRRSWAVPLTSTSSPTSVRRLLSIVIRRALPRALLPLDVSDMILLDDIEFNSTLCRIRAITIR